MSRILPTLITFLLCMGFTAHAQQPVNTWSDAFALAGVDNTVTALVESNGRIYVGGIYDVAGSEITRLEAVLKNWTGR